MARKSKNIWQDLAAVDARRAGIDPNVFTRQINQESGFNPLAQSGAGAVGIAQIVPKYNPDVNPNNPYESLKWAAHYMAGLIHKYGSYAAALSVYNSGRPNAYEDPNFAQGQTYNYVKSIMGGQTPSEAIPTQAPARTSAVPIPQQNNSSLTLLKGLLADKDVFSLLQSLNSTKTSQPAFSVKPSYPNKIKNKPGVPVADLSSVGGLHPTEGLPGFPAHDYFAKPGTPVVAPVTGTVIKLSGHDPRLGPIQGPHGPLGWSVYIQGKDGSIYYLTHMGNRSVKLGQKLTEGTPIGTV